MGQAAEHHMAHLFYLLCDGAVDRRVIVAVDNAPPRRHAVDQFGAVGKPDAASVSRFGFISRQRIGGRCIGVPQVLPVPGIAQGFKINIVVFCHCITFLVMQSYEVFKTYCLAHDKS